jgi:hypothetical protein
MAHRQQNQNGCHGRAPRYGGQHARAAPHPIAARRHGRAEQQGQCRVARHRIILLRGGEGEENQQKAGPAQGQQARPAGAVQRFERQPRDGRKVDAPGKQPEQMEEPEVQSRDRIVVARRAQIQEPQHLLVHEVEPQEAVVFAGHAAHREVEIGRIAQRRQHVPGRGDQQHDGEAAPGAQTLPHLARKQLPREQQIDSRRAPGNTRATALLSSRPTPRLAASRNAHSADAAPLVQHAQEGPHGERDGSRQHHVGNQNARKQEQSDAGGDRQARVETGAPCRTPTCRRPRSATPGHAR